MYKVNSGGQMSQHKVIQGYYLPSLEGPLQQTRKRTSFCSQFSTRENSLICPAHDTDLGKFLWEMSQKWIEQKPCSEGWEMALWIRVFALQA